MAQYAQRRLPLGAILGAYVAEFAFCDLKFMDITPGHTTGQLCSALCDIMKESKMENHFEIINCLHDAVMELQHKHVSDFDTAPTAFPYYYFFPESISQQVVSVFHLAALSGHHEFVLHQVTRSPSMIESTQRRILLSIHSHRSVTLRPHTQGRAAAGMAAWILYVSEFHRSFGISMSTSQRGAITSQKQLD